MYNYTQLYIYIYIDTYLYTIKYNYTDKSSVTATQPMVQPLPNGLWKTYFFMVQKKLKCKVLCMLYVECKMSKNNNPYY